MVAERRLRRPRAETWLEPEDGRISVLGHAAATVAWLRQRCGCASARFGWPDQGREEGEGSS